jgi:N-acetylglucosamine kinase-like BadF-type ATPase
MNLVADAGSTKTQWLSSNNTLAETMGFNPLFHDTSTILSALKNNQDLVRISNEIRQVFFYGAACSNDERKKIVHNALFSFFTKAAIYVGHDLEGAAYATYMGEPTIACIIGTGSNSCLYDGKEIYEEVPSLGYILGDEGSGGQLGKFLITDFLYKKTPPYTTALLTEKYGLTKEIVFENIYKKPNANVYIASFAKVFTESEDKAYINSLVHKSITDFVENHVKCYTNYSIYPVSFVGSIAFHFADIIETVLHENRCKKGIIIKNPVERLLEIHTKSN